MINVITDAFKSVELEGKEGKIVRVDEGDKVSFALESTGESRVGTVMKIQGKGEKTKLQIMPEQSECEEVWSIMNMAEGSLTVVK